MSVPRGRVRGGIVMLVLGSVAVLAPITAYLNLRQTHAQEVADVEGLRQALEATQVALSRATTATDSARLLESVQSRAWYLGRREYHVPSRAARLERWWRPGGAPTVLVAAGVALMIGAALVLRRRTEAA